MTIRVLPAGDRAVLVHTHDLATSLSLTALIRQARLPEIEDLIPACESVLIRLSARTDMSQLAVRVLDLATGVRVEADAEARNVAHPLVIPVHYDGPDLPEVSRATGLSGPEIISAHTGTPWRAAFVGFAPGFAYLAGGDARLNVARRAESRTTVPAGSVALAGEFSAIYPRQSPGGWQIIGSTAATLWDDAAEPPAAIQPGGWVRFVDIAAGDDTAALPSDDGSACRTAGGARP